MWDDVVEEDSPAPAPEVPTDAPATAAADAEGAQPEVAEPPPSENVTRGTEPKKIIFKHWIR